MGHLMDAVTKPEIREGLFRAQPGTLDEAIEAALGTEAFLKMEVVRTDGRQPRYKQSTKRVMLGPTVEKKTLRMP